jgi:hypothetical protein
MHQMLFATIETVVAYSLQKIETEACP